MLRIRTNDAPAHVDQATLWAILNQHAGKIREAFVLIRWFNTIVLDCPPQNEMVWLNDQEEAARLVGWGDGTPHPRYYVKLRAGLHRPTYLLSFLRNNIHLDQSQRSIISHDNCSSPIG